MRSVGERAITATAIIVPDIAEQTKQGAVLEARIDRLFQRHHRAAVRSCLARVEEVAKVEDLLEHGRGRRRGTAIVVVSVCRRFRGPWVDSVARKRRFVLRTANYILCLWK